jgi:hypothetical protein
VPHRPQRLRAQVSSTLASAAGPYGYTISLGGATVLASGHLGSPPLLGALLLVLGAVAAFMGLEFLAQGSLVPGDPPSDRPPSVWGNAHVPSAGAAVAAVWGLVHRVGGSVAWFVTGFTATLVYFAVTAIQRMAVDALVARRSRARRRRSPDRAAG